MNAKNFKDRLILAGLLLFTWSAPADAQSAPVLLSFDYPTNELAGMTFRAYSTNNVTAPVITWPLLSTFTNTNAILNLPGGINFVVVQASNKLGTSFFSNAVQGIIPRSDPIPVLSKVP